MMLMIVNRDEEPFCFGRHAFSFGGHHHNINCCSSQWNNGTRDDEGGICKDIWRNGWMATMKERGKEVAEAAFWIYSVAAQNIRTRYKGGFKFKNPFTGLGGFGGLYSVAYGGVWFSHVNIISDRGNSLHLEKSIKAPLKGLNSDLVWMKCPVESVDSINPLSMSPYPMPHRNFNYLLRKARLASNLLPLLHPSTKTECIQINSHHHVGRCWQEEVGSGGFPRGIVE